MPLPAWAKPIQATAPPAWATPLQAEAPGPAPEVVAQERGVPFEEYVRPTLEFGGMLAGGALGSAAGPVGSAAGGGLGYAAGKNIADLLYTKRGTLPQELAKTGMDVARGAAMETGGQALGVALPAVARGVGKGVSQALGGLTGKGSAAIEQAVQSGAKGTNLLAPKTAFSRAMRGEITGEEIVKHAKEGLEGLKSARGEAYRAQLEQIKLDPTAKTGIKGKVTQKMSELVSPDKFDIKMVRDSAGKLTPDFSESTLAENHTVITKALRDIDGWKDLTAAGFDKLKRRIGTYVDQVPKGSPQSTMLTQLRDSISSGLKESIPGYEKMSKGYSEATTLIKDLEAGLMLRKQGMSGRIVADQTLRRLTSAMKDNAPLRRDLVKALENKAPDLQGEIAGFTMGSLTPGGLAGSSLGQTGGLALMVVNPKLWPVLAASSPRVAGEFLQFFGGATKVLKGSAPTIGRGVAYTGNKLSDTKQNALSQGAR